MLRRVTILVVFLALFSHAKAQKYTLSGFVKDSATGETINNALISIKNNKATAVSNNYGFFSFTIEKGNWEISVSASSFIQSDFTVQLDKNKQINIVLLPETETIGEVNIRAKKNDNVKKIDISTQTISGKTIKKIPAFLGEADVIKSVQLLPGVTTVGEGASGFNVRGGAIDQNLVLMDEAPVFNSAHLFGFFSIFNPDAVKDVQLIKGGIPANYGGRLSSVLEVITRDGNKKQVQANGGIGTIFSRFTLEGPIVKNKASFMVSGRRSYVDLLAKPFLNSGLKDSRFYFYDLTTKLNYNYNAMNTLFISSYIGDDIFYAANAFGVKWGNSTVTARWNHIFNKKLFSNFTYYYSRYRYNLEFGSNDASFNWYSYIINNSVKGDLKYYLSPKVEIGTGIQSTYYNFIPGNATSISNGETRSFSLPDKYGMENAAYLTSDINSTGKFSVRAGLRVSQFLYLGKGNYYTYKDPLVGQRKIVTSTTVAGNNEVIANYFNWEPRLGFKYAVNKSASIKGGYNRMVQNLHLISNTAASVPFDVWTPSTNNIKPEIADQLTIGYFKNFSGKNNDYEASVETYYKALQNQIDYIDGANLLLNRYLEGELMSGKGRAYGLELYLKKNTGNLTGWISYTLSRSERQVTGISNGNWYPNRFDRLNNLYIVAQYKYSEKWEFAANFVFSSGTPTTFYSGQYNVQGYTIPDAGNNTRNNVRNPNYHRLDLSATYNIKKKKNWESSWVFSVYNAYNRRNPFSIYFSTNYGNLGQNKAVQFSVIGGFIPAIAYNFKWR